MKLTLFVSCLLLIFISTIIPIVVSHQCQTNQATLLLQMKHTLIFNSTSSESLSKWNETTDCCTWDGVGCDKSGHVISLLLPERSVTGGFDDSSSLFDLKHLEWLDLTFGMLSNAKIPSRLGNLTNLNYLHLSDCNLTGPIPASIVNLTKLEELELSSNQLSGPIPQFPNSLGYLDLYDNSFVGDISSIDLTHFPNLTYLDLSHNSFHGTIPTSLYRLEYLDLSSNMFHGSVHLDTNPIFGNLYDLDLSHNNLTVKLTTIPPNLQYLKLASCNISKIPNFGREFTELDLSENRISGDIPAWVPNVRDLNLSFNSFVGFQRRDLISRPYIVDLRFNKLEGNIPPELCNATYLDISYNNFNSSLPFDFGNTQKPFVFFSASNNNLTGVIPTSICTLLRKTASFTPDYIPRVLDLSFNHLSGEIPSCLFDTQHAPLDVLNLRNNRFSGTIPYMSSSSCLFRTISLNSNLLRGTIPRALANCYRLEVFDIGKNNFHGGFPCWLKKISSLRILVLGFNKFHDDISCIENNSWSVLQILDLAFNNFSGELPKKALAHWKVMAHESQSKLEILGYANPFFSESSYRDVVPIIIKGYEVELVKILNIFTIIDLSSNHFEGTIPEEIGSLESLHFLNLSRNSLTGSIPPSIGKMVQLESLDLSANHLRGHLPAELASLNFLAVLNLSYNEFVGRIPTSTQLQSFSTSSYEGNEGLCGPPLRDCSSKTHQIPEVEQVREERSIFDWRMGLVIGVGFGTGFVAVVIPLIFSDKVNLWYEKLLHLV